MYPILFKSGFITIYSYGVMVAIAALVVLFLSARDARKHNISPDIIQELGLWIIIGGIIGGRLSYVLFNLDHYIKNPIEIIMLNHGGLIFYGGFLVSIFVFIGYIKKKNLKINDIIYVFVPFVPIGHALGRIGCFLNGCCHGKLSGTYMYPTQIYEAIVNIFICGFLLKLRKKYKKHIIYLYMLFYGISRFFIEFFRGDEVYILMNLRISQWVSLALVIIASVKCRSLKSQT